MAELAGELLERLRCPVTKTRVVASGEWVYGTDPERRLKYPIVGGVPVMTPGAGVAVAKDEFDALIARAQHATQAT